MSRLLDRLFPERAYRRELAYFANLPTDAWQPIGDGSKNPPPGFEPQTGALELTPPVKLSSRHYHGAMHAILRAAHVAYENRAHATYTEGPARWDGIANHRRSILGEYPHDADCSSFATWCYWDGIQFLIRLLGLGDILNGANWQAGYTGTLTEHGQAIEYGHTVPGDICLYGGTVWVPQHATMTIGGGRCISMGHPGDPGIYPINLNGSLPIVGIRRYLTH